MADTPLNENALNFFKQFEDSTKKIEPINSGLITNPDEEDFNFWETVGGLSLSAAPSKSLPASSILLERAVKSKDVF